MKTRIQPFKILSFAVIVFCAAATGAFAGQHFHSANASPGASFSGSVNHANIHTNTNAQIQTNTRMQTNTQMRTNRDGASGRSSSSSVRTQNSHGSSQVNANKNGVLSQHQQEIRHHEVFGW